MSVYTMARATWGPKAPPCFNCASAQLIASVDLVTNEGARYKVWLSKMRIHKQVFPGHQIFWLIFSRFDPGTDFLKMKLGVSQQTRLRAESIIKMPSTARLVLKL